MIDLTSSVDMDATTPINSITPYPTLQMISPCFRSCLQILFLVCLASWELFSNHSCRGDIMLNLANKLPSHHHMHALDNVGLQLW